jgi:hypothetical protein
MSPPIYFYDDFLRLGQKIDMITIRVVWNSVSPRNGGFWFPLWAKGFPEQFLWSCHACAIA